MKPTQTIYPDISDIFEAKAARRRDIARRSFGEKIAMMEALRERLAPFKRLRERRKRPSCGCAPDKRDELPAFHADPPGARKAT